MWLWDLTPYLPVQGIAHLYGNQDGESHGHRIRRLKNRTLDASELCLVLTALQIVGLWMAQLVVITFLKVYFLFFHCPLSSVEENDMIPVDRRKVWVHLEPP